MDLSCKISPPWKDVPFIRTEKNNSVQGATASLESFVIALLRSSEITVEIAVTELVSLSTMGMGITSPG